MSTANAAWLHRHNENREVLETMGLAAWVTPVYKRDLKVRATTSVAI